jgi:PilZ domain
LRAAYSATVARRRKHHREPVVVLATVSTRTQPLGQATAINVSEGGIKLRTSAHDFVAGVSLSASDELNIRFVLPGAEHMLDLPGTVVWATSDACGVRFGYVPDTQRTALQEWLTACVERSISRVCERVREACA